MFCSPSRSGALPPPNRYLLRPSVSIVGGMLCSVPFSTALDGCSKMNVSVCALSAEGHVHSQE